MNKQQLANRIWASANKMRSKIDANEYKDYILGLIFYKFLSDTEEKYLMEKMGLEKDDLKELVEDFDNPDMKKLIEECQKSIGYFIEYKNLFNAWLSKDVDFSVAVLTDALTSFDRLMSPNYESVYLGIFKTLREGLSKLGDNPTSQTKALRDLIQLIKDIPTDGRQDYDVLGYVYEYLISNFAANAGKKAGEFYTPHEVAQVMSEIVAEDQKDKDHIGIYDPTSGSGSLLITIGKSVGKHIADQNKVVYYAQELKENTYNLTRMNLVMRGILPQNIHTRCADSLEEDWPVNTEGKDIGELDAAVPLLEESLDHYRRLVALTKDNYLYANSMQTAQRRIPIGGDNGKMKTWAELLPEYEKELKNLKKNISMLKAKAAGTYKETAEEIKSLRNADVQNVVLITRPDGNSASQEPKRTAAEFRQIAKGTRLFTDIDSIVTAVAPELEGLKALPLSYWNMKKEATVIDFTAKKPVTLLVGYFRDDQIKYAPAPKLETDASANDYGQAEAALTSAIQIDGMPQVNVHPYHFGAGHHTLSLPKGILLVLGFTDSEPAQRDCGLSGSDKSIDWLFH